MNERALATVQLKSGTHLRHDLRAIRNNLDCKQLTEKSGRNPGENPSFSYENDGFSYESHICQ